MKFAAASIVGTAAGIATYNILTENKEEKLERFINALPSKLDGAQSVSVHHVPGSRHCTLFIPTVHGDGLMMLPPEAEQEHFPRSFTARSAIHENIAKMLADLRRRVPEAFPLPVYWDGVGAGDAGAGYAFKLIMDARDIDREIETFKREHGCDPASWSPTMRMRYDSLVNDKRRVAVHITFPPVIRELTLNWDILLRGFESPELTKRIADFEYRRKMAPMESGATPSDLAQEMDTMQLQRTVAAIAAVMGKETGVVSCLGMGVEHSYFTHILDAHNTEHPDFPFSHVILEPQGITAYHRAKENEDEATRQYLERSGQGELTFF